MRNRLLQIAVLLAFAATALPGSAGLHWMLGLEHHHSHALVTSDKQTAKVHQRAGCKHHHHNSADDSVPTNEPQESNDDCSICHFYSQPMSNSVAFIAVSVEVAPVTVPLVEEVVHPFAPLATPPARGPPSLA